MDRLETAGMIFLALNALLSYLAFQKPKWFDIFLLRISDLNNGQYYRLLTAGFIHVDWSHFFFNMFSLFIFGGAVERDLGILGFVIVYIGSLVGGNLLSWLFYRKEPEYRAVGASGAISGIIFAAIIIYPEMELAFIFLPFYFPAWIYGIGFILYSLYGMGRQHDNIGHEAHLGGAITGLLICLALDPSLMQESTLTILYILVPALVMLFVFFYKPRLIAQAFGKGDEAMTIDDKYNAEQRELELELNRILEKIKLQGQESLSTSERDFLGRQ
ncbi:MAG: membrane associated rhomboid family serine protease [Roseivirga sp.]|jgi:membrane associated rhomboid family serine protease